MQRFIQFFPLWAILLSALAYFFPALFIPLKPGIIPLLMVIMFGMGITLTLGDFLRVLRQPSILLLGVALQYSIMPLAALLVARLLDLPTALLVGEPGRGSLRALQFASLIVSVPLFFIFIVMGVSLVRALRQDERRD